MSPTLTDIPEVSKKYADDPYGSLQELREDPIGLFERVRAECGGVGRRRLRGVPRDEAHRRAGLSGTDLRGISGR